MRVSLSLWRIKGFRGQTDNLSALLYQPTFWEKHMGSLRTGNFPLRTEPSDGKATQTPGRDHSYFYKSLRLKTPGNKNHKLRHLGHPHVSVH